MEKDFAAVDHCLKMGGTMAYGDSSVDPNHSQIKQSINRLAVALLVIGVPLGLTGFFLVISVFFSGMSGEMMSGDPNSMGRRALIGLLMAGAGAFMAIFGSSMLFGANLGRIARYQAQEGLPVAKDVVRDMTPVLSQTVRELSNAVKSGAQSNRFCPSCGAGVGKQSRFCEQCGTKLDSAA